MATGDGGADGYAPGDDRPLAPYSVLMATFGTAFSAGVLALARSDRVPERIGLGDVLLLGVATHKVSRLASKDKVTSFLRAPFTRYQGPAGEGEVDEEPRGTGVQKAVGELVVCPYCLAQWVAAGFLLGFAAAPRTTRLVAAVYTAETVSDFLQLAYRAAEARSEPPGSS